MAAKVIIKFQFQAAFLQMYDEKIEPLISAIDYRRLLIFNAYKVIKSNPKNPEKKEKPNDIVFNPYKKNGTIKLTTVPTT